MFWAEGMMRHGMVRALQDGWCPEEHRGPTEHYKLAGFYPRATSSGIQNHTCTLERSVSSTVWKKGEAGDGETGNTPCPTSF